MLRPPPADDFVFAIKGRQFYDRNCFGTSQRSVRAFIQVITTVSAALFVSGFDIQSKVPNEIGFKWSGSRQKNFFSYSCTVHILFFYYVLNN